MNGPRVFHRFSYGVSADNWPLLPWPRYAATNNDKRMRPVNLRFGVEIYESATFGKREGKLLTTVSGLYLTGPRVKRDGSEGVTVSLEFGHKDDFPGFATEIVYEALNASWDHLCENVFSREELAESYLGY